MWKYYGRISQLGFFILYIIFYSFISFSSTHVSPIPLLLFLFLLQNLLATSFALLIRERQRQRERRKTRGSMFTMPSEIEVHHALPRPPSHRCSSSSPPSSWIRSACSFLFFFFLFFFFFSYLLVLIQLYFIRIGICFVFCVWIMWETGLDRFVLFFFSFFFFFFIFASSDSTLF